MMPLALRIRRNDRLDLMPDSMPLECPYCGEPVELDVDESGGARQRYVEDCPVCCRPWQVEVVCDRDGDWLATLRTSDE